MEAMKSLTDCHFYSKGGCTKREACEFRHVHSPETFEATKVCKFWRLDTCADMECKFRHPTLPRASDGSLIMCAFEMHGGCAKRDFCPYSHKYEAKPPITGLAGEELPSRLQITLAPPSSEPRFVSRPTPATTTDDDVTATHPNGTEGAQETTTEPAPKKLRPEGAKAASSSIIGLDARVATTENKPQAVSFVKSFQDILKERELEKEKEKQKEKGKEKAEEKEQTDKAPAVAAGGNKNQGAGRGQKRKKAEAPSKKQETPKAAQQQPKQQPQRKQSVLDRLSLPGSGSPSATSGTTSPISPKAAPSFGIRSLGDLMKEKQPQQGQAANLATSAGARTEPEAKKQKKEQLASTPALSSAAPSRQAKPSPSVVGQKRKLDETTPTPTTTQTAKATPTPSAAAQTKAAPAAAEEESFEDLEKELEELGVVLEDGAEEEIDLGIDLDVGE